MPDEHPIPEQTDELAFRLFHARFTRTNGREPDAVKLADLQPGMRDVWRTMALSVQDVLGATNVGDAMAVMDNIAASRSRNTVERIRSRDQVTITPEVAMRNVFGEAAT